MTTLVSSKKPAAADVASLTDADADFERRWAIWQAAGLAQEQAGRRHMSFIVVAAAIVAVVILVLTLLA